MHHQWDADARQLFAAAGQVANADEFVASDEVVDKLSRGQLSAKSAG